MKFYESETDRSIPKLPGSKIRGSLRRNGVMPTQRNNNLLRLSHQNYYCQSVIVSGFLDKCYITYFLITTKIFIIYAIRLVKSIHLIYVKIETRNKNKILIRVPLVKQPFLRWKGI
jgi:hypothetical protein